MFCLKMRGECTGCNNTDEGSVKAAINGGRIGIDNDHHGMHMHPEEVFKIVHKIVFIALFKPC